MGTEARIVLYASSLAAAETAAMAAFARIAALDAALSDYRIDSELSRLSAASGGDAVRVSDDLLRVLRASTELSRETNGAFDITAGPAVALWREARRAGRLPETGAVCTARALVDWRHVVHDTLRQTVRLSRPAMRLDLGGIAKGYAADAAGVVLRALGVDRWLVEIGGEILAGDAPPGEGGWLVAMIDTGVAPIRIERRAVSTSGDAEQFVEIGGIRYSHVVDPRTGFALTSRASATVIAPTAMQADGWSTAVTVMDSVERARFVTRHPEGTFLVRGQGTGGRVQGGACRGQEP